MPLISLVDVLEKSPGRKCPLFLRQPPSGVGIVRKHEAGDDGDADGDYSLLYRVVNWSLMSKLIPFTDTYNNEKPAPALDAVGAIEVAENGSAQETTEHIGKGVA